MDGTERAIMAGRHRLQHIEDLAAADLANDDPIGPHTQRIAHQLTRRDFAFAFDVGRARPSRTTCGCCSTNSAESSIVTTRSSTGMKAEIQLSIVVLPEPVPPQTSTLRRARMIARMNSTMSCVMLSLATRSSTE